MSIDSIRLNQRAKDQLITLKRRTGIRNWNVLCRWALCASLAESSVPPEIEPQGETAVEMTWRTFAGEQSALYEALLAQRCVAEGHELTDAIAQQQLHAHIYRGIGYLAGDPDVSSISKLVRSGTPPDVLS